MADHDGNEAQAQAEAQAHDGTEAQAEEGWFTDPYARHEARWLSDGKPTKLVRDGAIESFDEPPEGDPVAEPVRIEQEGPPGDEEFVRAEDAWGDRDTFHPSLGDILIATDPPAGRGLPEAGVYPHDPPQEI
jgi:hypothetical protein